MNWEIILKEEAYDIDEIDTFKIIAEFNDAGLGVNFELIKAWSELKKNMPEEDEIMYREEIEQIGQVSIDLARALGALVQAARRQEEGA